jgi:farnesyl-diphosphate farnesyltransferase
VAVAYLLFRIANTFEDATRWPRSDRLDALREFSDLVREPSRGAGPRARALVARGPALDNEGYLELVRPDPGRALRARGLRPGAAQRHRAAHAAHRRGHGPLSSSAPTSGSLRLGGPDDLKAYCYRRSPASSASWLTDLFLDAAPQLGKVEPTLRARERAFGEGCSW